MSPAPDARRFTLARACTPFAWLGVALLVASVLGLALPLLLPGFASQPAALEGLNPLHSVVELELPRADDAELEVFALEVAEAYPDLLVERGTAERATWLAVVGRFDTSILARELQALARERGHEPGSFSMGTNLARVMGTRLLSDPAAAVEALAALLPLALFCSAGVLLLFGALLRRRLPPATAAAAAGQNPLSAPRKAALGAGLGLLLALVIQGLGLLAAQLGAPITEQPWLLEAFAAGGSRWWPVLAVVVFLAPLGEEVFFRGYLLPALAEPWGRSGAVLLSSAAFAAIHGHAAALPAYFVYGVGLALAARRTGSLMVPIVAHSVVNSLAVAGLVWGAS